MEIIERIDRFKAELDALRPLDAEHEARIMQKFRLDWNFHSNHLEGNSLSYGETKALILFGITAQGKPLKDHLEMTGHNEAIKWIEEVVREERPLTENFIRQLHQLLLKEPYQVDAVTPSGQPTKKWVKVGEYKTTPNNVITVTGEPFYFASPEETPAKMHDLIEWYRAEQDKSELHPLLLAAEFHYKFVRIHPFDDGNGRTARILMNFILMQHGLPPVIIKTQDKENYFAALRQADAGLLEPFIEYIGENLARSLDTMLKGAKGESIDEPDDVDKEIALLEQRLKILEKNPLIRRSYDIQLDIFEYNLFPLFEKYLSNSEKFNKFYESTEIDIFGKYEGGEKFGFQVKEYEELKQNILKELQNQKVFESIFVKHDYKRFKSDGIAYFDFKQLIIIEFGKYKYEIKHSNDDAILSHFYSQNLSESAIEDFVSILYRLHTSFINQKIEEAQQNRKM